MAARAEGGLPRRKGGVNTVSPLSRAAYEAALRRAHARILRVVAPKRGPGLIAPELAPHGGRMHADLGGDLLVRPSSRHTGLNLASLLLGELCVVPHGNFSLLGE